MSSYGGPNHNMVQRSPPPFSRISQSLDTSKFGYLSGTGFGWMAPQAPKILDTFPVRDLGKVSKMRYPNMLPPPPFSEIEVDAEPCYDLDHPNYVTGIGLNHQLARSRASGWAGKLNSEFSLIHKC